MNKYLEKIALNRYEKHLYDGGKAGNDLRAMAAQKSMITAKTLRTGPTADLLGPIAGSAAVSSIKKNRQEGPFSKGGDILSKKNPGYARIAGPFTTSTPEHINYGGTNKLFKNTRAVPNSIPKETSSILSKAKNILGSKAALKGGVLVAGGAAALAGGAYLATRQKKDTK